MPRHRLRTQVGSVRPRRMWAGQANVDSRARGSAKAGVAGPGDTLAAGASFFFLVGSGEGSVDK